MLVIHDEACPALCYGIARLYDKRTGSYFWPCDHKSPPEGMGHDCDCNAPTAAQLEELVEAAKWINWEEANNRPEGIRLAAARKPFVKEKK